MPSRPGAHDLISGEKPNSWLFDENVKKSNHAPRRAHDLISGEKPNSWLFDENVKKSNHAPHRAHDLISGGKAEFLPPP